MPAKPSWLNKIDDVIRELEALSRPFVDRATVELLLGVGRRRAQQIMSPCIMDRVGTNGLADRDAFIAHLKRIASGEGAYYEEQRRQRFWAHLSEVRREWIKAPPVRVEMSNAQVRRLERDDFEGLPEGVELAAGSIVVRFSGPEEALQKLLALAMAISQNRPGFDQRVSVPRPWFGCKQPSRSGTTPDCRRKIREYLPSATVLCAQQAKGYWVCSIGSDTPRKGRKPPLLFAHHRQGQGSARAWVAFFVNRRVLFLELNQNVRRIQVTASRACSRDIAGNQI